MQEGVLIILFPSKTEMKPNKEGWGKKGKQKLNGNLGRLPHKYQGEKRVNFLSLYFESFKKYILKINLYHIYNLEIFYPLWFVFSFYQQCL